VVTEVILKEDVKLPNTAEIQGNWKFILKITLENMLKKSQQL
jgi:hypothetical protein